MVNRKWLVLGVMGVGIAAALCSAREGLAHMSTDLGMLAGKDAGVFELAGKDAGVFDLAAKDGGVFELTAKEGGGWELAAKKDGGVFQP